MIIRLNDVPDVLQPPRPMRMKRVINRLQHTEGISLTWVEIWGRHERVVCDRSDRAYYIIEGEGVFQVGDDPAGAVAAGDVVFIPRDVPYVFEGRMTYIVLNGPAFIEGSDTVLD